MILSSLSDDELLKIIDGPSAPEHEYSLVDEAFGIFWVRKLADSTELEGHVIEKMVSNIHLKSAREIIGQWARLNQLDKVHLMRLIELTTQDAWLNLQLNSSILMHDLNARYQRAGHELPWSDAEDILLRFISTKVEWAVDLSLKLLSTEGFAAAFKAIQSSVMSRSYKHKIRNDARLRGICLPPSNQKGSHKNYKH
jgi:hypothetical protein